MTTVASLIDEQAEEESAAPETSTPAPETVTPAPEPVPAEKKSASQLASEWGEDGEEVMEEETETNMAANTKPEDKTEEAATEEAKEDDVSPRKSGRPRKPTEKVLEAADQVEEESVEAIAKELATSDKPPAVEKTKTTASPKKSGKGKLQKRGNGADTADLVSLIFGGGGGEPQQQSQQKNVLIAEGEEEEDPAKKSAKKGRPKKKDLDEKVDMAS